MELRVKVCLAIAALGWVGACASHEPQLAHSGATMSIGSGPCTATSAVIHGGKYYCLRR